MQHHFIGYSATAQNNTTYPPHDIIKIPGSNYADNDEYLIRFAVAGFSRDELEVVRDKGKIVVSGKPTDSKLPDTAVFKHRGISRKQFKQEFNVADSIEISSVKFEDGILKVQCLHVVPENEKPKKYDIS